MGVKVYPDGTQGHWGLSDKYAQDRHTKGLVAGTPKLETAPATEAARQWEGWYYGLQSLKPALEPICLAQKPFSEKTGYENVLRWGTGALNIDKCRVPCEGKPVFINGVDRDRNRSSYDTGGSNRTGEISTEGRWPANVAHDGSPEVMEAFAQFGELVSTVRGTNCGANGGNKTGNGIYSDLPLKGYPAGTTYADAGTAARFFFSAPYGMLCDLCGDEVELCKSAKDAEMSRARQARAAATVLFGQLLGKDHCSKSRAIRTSRIRLRPLRQAMPILRLKPSSVLLAAMLRIGRSNRSPEMRGLRRSCAAHAQPLLLENLQR